MRHYLSQIDRFRRPSWRLKFKMGFVFTNNDIPEFNFSDEWFEDFNKAYETINEADAIQESDMQKDLRAFITEGDE